MYIHYNQMICYICGNKTKAIVLPVLLFYSLHFYVPHVRTIKCKMIW